MPLPRDRASIDALPYRLDYGHWGLTASIGDPRYPTIIAYAGFPVGSRGPIDPPHVQDETFGRLDAAARAALAA